MAKRLLLNVLVKILGEFVELDEDNLSWAVWAGQIKLNNLKLKPENILKGYQFTIFHGIVQSLEITIPWGSFLANPLKIKLSGVLLDLGPIDVSQMDKADVIKGLLEKKLQKLALVDQYLELEHVVSTDDGKAGGSNESYVQQWTSQIIDNVEVSLSDIHVRYEDHFSIPGEVFAAGFTLESFTLSTCDESWQSAFIKKSNKPGAYVNKMATLNNLGVYWEPSSDVLSTLPLERWTEAMLTMIHRRGQAQDRLHYMLAPVDNSVTVKLIHCQFPVEGSFQYDLKIESKNAVIAIDNQQFEQGFLFFYRFDAVRNIHDPNSYRPSERPTTSPEAAQLWWRYALQLVKARPRYTHLVRLAKTAQVEDVLPDVLMSQAEIKELKMLELHLPLSVLQTFRQAALTEWMQDRSEKAKAAASSPGRDGAEDRGSWWNGWSSSKGVRKEDDISLKTLLHGAPNAEVAHSASAPPINLTSPSIKVTIQASTSLLLTENFRSLVEAQMAFTTSVLTMQGKWEVSTDVMDMNVRDTLHAGGIFPFLLAVKTVTPGVRSAKQGTKPLLSLRADNQNNKVNISAAALPIEVFVNKHCLHSVMLAFTVPKNTFEKKLRRVFALKRPRNDQYHQNQFLQKAVLAGTQFSSQVKEALNQNHNINVEISLEMHGPKIVIPEDCLQDRGCLLLDCGFLSAKGAICPIGQSFDIALKAINAGLPLSVHDLSSVADRQLYLIKPFDLNVEFQSVVKDIADNTVNVSILPELRGEIDSDKLGRLLRVVTGLSDIASPKRGATTTVHPSRANGLGTASYGSASTMAMEQEVANALYLSPEPKAKTRSAKTTRDEGLGDDDNSDGFITPKDSSPGSGSKGRKRRSGASDNTPLMTQIQMSLQMSLDRARSAAAAAAAAAAVDESGPTAVIPRVPTNVDMRIGFKLPLLALDSTYDSESGHHVVIEVKELLLDMINRPFDRTIVFDINEFSVQDSFRHDRQKFVVWTPKSEESLVHVHFVSVISAESPLYRKHASEVKADFRELFLNVDVNTLLHLQPLFAALLDKKNRTGAPAPHANGSASMDSLPSESRFNQLLTGGSANAWQSPLKDGALAGAGQPTGMKIDMSMNRICVDLLKPSPTPDEPQVLLQSMFSMRMISMGVAMEMMELMRANVVLETFEIVDIRSISSDFVFKTLFCPLHSKSAGELPGETKKNVLLFLTFVQESKSHSFITVDFSGVTSYVAIDTMLEFSLLAMTNFFTLTSLLSAGGDDDATLVAQSVGKASDSKEAPIKCSTMNATVKMVDSQLILLEDPAMKESQAIVGRCALNVHFTRDTKDYRKTTEMYESLHITITDNEIFVLKNINHWNPLPILEPFDVECHVKRTVVNGATVYTSIQMEMDDMDARLSFNDLLLAQAIMSRRALVDSSSNSTATPKNASAASAPSAPASSPSSRKTTALQGEDEETEEVTASPTSTGPNAVAASVPPSLMVRFGLSTLKVVVVNDFNAASVPVVRLHVQDSNFYSEGQINQLSGEGSAQLKLDYYNARIATWEPCIETWTPMCRLYSENLSNIMEVRSDHTLQLTISGSMLETLLRSYTLFFHEIATERRIKSLSTSSEIVVNNLLGDGLVIDLLDSSSKSTLTHIEPNSQGVVTEIVDMARKTLLRTFRLPEAVDVLVSGEELQFPRLPIVHLPFNITKPKACFLQPAPLSGPEAVAAGQALLLEPIEEEVFENCRYDPFSGTWSKPYLPGDPYEWTDATGLVKKGFESVQINSNMWEWSASWEVDLDGIVGQEIDEAGWEYASSFSYFTMVSPRRAYQPLDAVRRRRWIRIRSPKITPQQFIQRSLTVFWDVQPLIDGTRKVDVRSSFEVVNKLGFNVMVSVYHHSWRDTDCEGDFVFGPLEVGAKLHVPLLKSYATHIRFKPDFPDYVWSGYVPCNVHSYDGKVVKEIVCKGGSAETALEGDGGGGGGAASSVTFRCWTIHENKAVEVILLPYVSICNKLLCGMQYRLTSSDDKEEIGAIASGSSAQCSYINLFNKPKISIKMSRFQWSKELLLDTKSEQQGLLIMQEGSEDPAAPFPLLPVCIRSRLDANFCLQIEIFFQVALVDLSGLELVAKAKFSNNKDLISTLSKQSGPIVSTFEGDTSAQPGNMVTYLHHKRLLADLVVNSSSSHISQQRSGSSSSEELVTVCDLGSPVYLDINARWTHLPLNLRKQVFIRTASVDKISRSNQFMTFSVLHKAIVFVLVDVNTAPKWLKYDAFVKTSEIAVARRKVRSKMLEYHYSIYGKVFEAGDRVELKGGWDKDIQCMYSVSVVPVFDTGGAVDGTRPAAVALSVRRLVDEVLFSSSMSLPVMDAYWIEGGNHATAFYSQDNFLSLRTINEDNWSEEISIDTRSNSSTKGSFEIVSYRSGMSYQLSYTMQNLPGIYHQTQLIKFMPRYCLLNCTDETLLISQKGSNKYVECYPYCPEGWHVVDNHFTTDVKIRTSGSLWSLGSININEVGTSLLYIPLADNNNENAGGSRGVVLHVEVKLAAPEDNCSIIVLIWRENIEAQAAMSVHNDSDVTITIRQSDIEKFHDVGDKLFLYELTVPAGKYVPFGWVDPECGTNIQVAVGTSISVASKRVAVINMLKAGQRLRLPYSSGKTGAIAGEILLDVTTSDAGHVLHISRSTAALFMEMGGDMPTLEGEESPAAAVDPQFASVPLFGFNLVLGSLGVSLVVERPQRRELFSLYMDRIEVFLKTKGPLKTLDFTVLDLQLDNYSESAVYPILIRSTKKEVHSSIAVEDEDGASGMEIEGSKVGGEKPFIELSVAVEQPKDAKCAVVKYFAFRILSVVVEVDSATMQLIFLDLLDDLKVLSAAQALAINVPERWLRDFNYDVFHPGQKLIDIYQSKASSQQSKMYIKTMVIHPMKVTVTFFQTAFPRRQRKETLQSTVLNAMMSLVGVENMQLRLNSFEVEDAMESTDTLVSLISARAVQDVRSQLAMIAGSLAMIGSPVGLARKVGSGVRAFFYEPYLGAVHGSQTFMSGLNKGTQRLFRGVVVGSLESAVAIVGTASRGMAYLTGDQEFVRKRAIRRQQNRSKAGGLYGGFMDGGESVISGITSGVKGLVSKPIEEAATGGIAGFFRGVGLGMLGAAVKPLVGLAEGVTSIAAGLTNQINTATKLEHVRPPRALQPAASDPSILVIYSLNLDAAFAQDFIFKRARQEQYQDSFLCYIPLGVKAEALILSEIYIFWRRPRNLWGRVWSNVSHCVFNHDSVGVMLYSGALRGDAELVIIPCGSVAHAKRVYAALAQNAYRMGNPAKVLPVDLLPIVPGEDSTKGESGRYSLVGIDAPAPADANGSSRERLHEEATRLSQLDNYRFGMVNGKILQRIQGSEQDVLSRWQYTIQRGCRSWKELDELIWSLLWEWGCIHSNLSSCRCCVALFVNRSDSPIQITRVQMLMGRRVVIMGSDNTGYELESRLLRPKGYIVIFISAFPQSPLEIGHLKANVNTVAFSTVLASTQREAKCEAKGGFTTGFLEKTVSEWWSKFVILTT